MTIGAAIAGTAISVGIKLLRPALEDLIVRVQERFGHNNGTGQVKHETVVDMGMVLADKLSTAGQIPGVLDKTAMGTIVEVLLQELRAKGVLPSDGAQPVVPAVTTLPTGKMVRLTGIIEVL